MSVSGDYAFAALQYLLPKHLLSRIVYNLTHTENVRLRNYGLSVFLRGYQVNMDEAVESNPYAYKSFNAFFTRALKSTARPIAPEANAFVSPVDGTVSQCGTISDDSILQAKGQSYSLLELLGGSCERAKKYLGGSFATIYLAPYNYHRIHMPFAGSVRETIYVPGDLFSVNASTARTVPRLFARNERVVCDFQGSHGCFSMSFIGALHVGSIETVWCGEVNPPPRRKKQPLVLDSGVGTRLAKGEEAGRFNMGSTVILVTEPGRVQWSDHLQPGVVVQLGQTIGTASTHAARCTRIFCGNQDVRSRNTHVEPSGSDRCASRQYQGTDRWTTSLSAYVAGVCDEATPGFGLRRSLPNCTRVPRRGIRPLP
jgi:phosphatidylserine decarboxylase